MQESEGVELSLLQEEGEKTSVVEDPEIDDYRKQFLDFMQAQFHRKYDLRSSRKRTRTQEQEEKMPQKETVVQKVGDKGKRLITEPLHSNDSILSSSKLASNPNINVKPILKEEKPPAESKEPKESLVEKPPPMFSLQKELEKVKISVPLTELLKQPAYQS